MRRHSSKRASASSRYRPPPFASTFPDLETAERAIAEILEQNIPQLENWLERGGRRLHLDDDLGRVVGRSADEAGGVRDVTALHTVLERDASMPEGIRVHNGYP